MTSDPNGADTPQPDVSTRLSNLEERLGAVEQMLARLSSGPALAGRPTPPPPPSPRLAPPPPPAPTVPAAAYPGPVEQPSKPLISAELALRWAGVVLVFLAALFLVSTAISRGWIGPEVQLGLATLGGVGLIATGIHLDRSWGVHRRPWSLALANTGVLVLGACAGAAHGWLDLIGVGAAFGFVVVVLALAVALADWFTHESLAISGLASALVVPGFIGAYDEFGEVATGAWLLFLVVVSMALAARYRWSLPRLLGLVVIGPLMVLLAGDFVDVAGSLLPVVQLMIAAAGLLWWLAPWLRPAEPPWRSLDHRLIFVVPALVWLSSSELWATTDRERGWAAIITAVGFGLVTSVLWLRRPVVGAIEAPANVLLFGQLVGVSGLVTAALALWFDGSWLLTVLAVQALGTTALATRIDDRLLDVNAGLLGAAVGIWTAGELVEGVDVGLDRIDGLVYLFVIAAAAVGAWLIRARSLSTAGLVAVASWVGLLVWIMAILRPVPQGQMLVSIIWAALGVILVVAGLGTFDLDRLSSTASLYRWRAHVKSVGLATLAATVVKLVTIDLAEVDTIWRALLFAVVGVGLLRLGYAVGVLERSDVEEPTPLD